jgi:DNA-binding NarL/FixJ family response regulator
MHCHEDVSDRVVSDATFGMRSMPRNSGANAGNDGDKLMATAARQKSTAISSAMSAGTFGIGKAIARTSIRVFVAANTEVEIDTISRILRKNAQLQIVAGLKSGPLDFALLASTHSDVLVMASGGDQLEDLSVIRAVRANEAAVEIVLLGKTTEEAHFLQCVRAGVHGYLPEDASSEEILQAVLDVREGAAVCPGKLCAGLFRYFETEAKSVPSATIHQRMGLTRREQQLIPLVAKGLTNKEIANHFSLSEQTIKNHLYRMKHKIGAEDRLSIVHLCRVQGFMV